MRKTMRKTFSLNIEVFYKAREIADRKHISLSGIVEDALAKFVENNQDGDE